MARIANETYAGNGSPWAQAVSNLGMALFGDPSEALRRKSAEQEMAYRDEQMANVKLQRQQLEANMKATAALQAQLQARLHPSVAAPAAAAAGTPTAPAAPNTSLATMMTEEGPADVTSEPSGEPAGEQITQPEGPLPQIDMQSLLAPTPQEMQAGQRTSTVQPVQPAAQPIPETGSGSDYYDVLGQRESGGDWNAQAPTSSAYGKYQITKGTARGLDMPADHAAWTPDVQQAGIEKLTTENLAAARQALGREPTDADLYAFHHFNPVSAAKVAQAPYNTPMAQVISPDELAANPYLADLTVGKWYEKVMSGGQFGAGQSFAGQPNASLANSDLFATEQLPPLEPQVTQATGPVPIGQEPTPIASQAVPLPPTKPDLAAMMTEETPADRTGEATGEPLSESQPNPTQAAAAATGANPNDPFAGLSDTEVAALATLPPDKLQEGLSKLLLDKAKHAPGSGVFQGDSMPAQLLNTIYEYETKKNRGEPTTPEEDYAYKLAVYQIRSPRQYVDPITHQLSEYTPGELPTMSGPQQPPPPTMQTAGTQQQQTATTGVTGVSPEQVLKSRTAAVPIDINNPATYAFDPADPTSQPPPEATSKLREIAPGYLPNLTEGQSKDLNWWGTMSSAQKSLDAAAAMGNDPANLKTYGLYQMLISDKPLLRAGAAKLMNDGERKYAYGVREFINAYLRKQTGAAIRNDEFDMYYPIFFPMPGDPPEEIAAKRQKRQQEINSLYVGLGNASGYADKLAQMNEQQQQQQQQAAPAAGNGNVALPGGTADDPLHLRKPKVP